MKKKDKNQSILVATTLLLGSIFAIAIVINNRDVSKNNDLVGTVYPNIQSKVEHSVDETLVPEAVQGIEMAEKDIIPNSVNIESVEIASNDFAVAFKQARMLLGPNNTFTWNGMVYTTDLADEVTTHSKQNESVVIETDIVFEIPKKEPAFSQEIENTP
tara:strand:+ start:96 stop:572 length:477 start_codon:yes stop_codon:yes gene_type:complete